MQKARPIFLWMVASISVPFLVLLIPSFLTVGSMSMVQATVILAAALAALLFFAIGGVSLSLYGINRGRREHGTRVTLGVSIALLAAGLVAVISGFKTTIETFEEESADLAVALRLSSWYECPYRWGWGFVNGESEFVIEPKFDGAYPFDSNRAVVELQGRHGVIDPTGQWVVQPVYDNAGVSYSEDLLQAARGDVYGYVDLNGNIAIPFEFEGAEAFSQGLAGARVEGKWGFIDKTGQYVIPPRYDGVGRFFEDRAWVNLGGRRVQREFDGEFSIEFAGGKWGYVDRQGQVVIPMQFEDAGSFHEGRATVMQNGEWFYIDVHGKPLEETDE